MFSLRRLSLVGLVLLLVATPAFAVGPGGAAYAAFFLAILAGIALVGGVLVATGLATTRQVWLGVAAYLVLRLMWSGLEDLGERFKHRLDDLPPQHEERERAAHGKLLSGADINCSTSLCQP